MVLVSCGDGRPEPIESDQVKWVVHGEGVLLYEFGRVYYIFTENDEFRKVEL